jgi:large subunit ribosomal protein L17
MRHNKKFNHLGRTSSHRKAMLANMACSLIMHKRIKTTVAKAKALRMFVEPLITKTRNLSTEMEKTNAQRLVFSYLQDNKAVKELFGEVRDMVAERNGGYTRILKLGNRVGDAAEICYIELVDYNANMLTAPKSASEKKKTRRSRKKADAPAAEAPAAE